MHANSWGCGSTCSVHSVWHYHIHGCFLPYIGPPHTADGPSASCITSLRAANVINGRYIYMEDLLGLEECIDTTPPVAWPVAPSPVHLSNWEGHLRTHPDKRFATYICSSLANGFRIGFNRQGSVLGAMARNHPSATSNREAVQDYITSEMGAGRLVGPIRESLIPFVHVSPLGLVPKSHQPNRFRMIVDLSFPKGRSVNDGISKVLASISYASVDDAVHYILTLGRGAQLVKLDLRNAYRIVPVHPQDQRLLAISWEGGTYVDRALPFGLRSAPKIFSAVADTIAWVLHGAGIERLIHYLDDFLFVGSPNTDEAAQAKEIALRVLEHLGVPVAAHKTEGPASLITFLGILVDTEAFELRLPAEKIGRLQALLDSWVAKKACTGKELESLLGHLSHAASVIRPGRTFLRQLFDLLHKVRLPRHFVRLTAGAKADLAWWRCFMQNWGGTSFFPLPTPASHVYSDASGTYGCGAVVDERCWLQSQWPTGWEDIDIATKELVPVVAAAALWGKLWGGQHIRFHSDNSAVVAVLSSRTARSPLLMHLLRCFSFYSAYYGFHFSAEHVPGVMNTAADALSQNNLPLFHFLMPQAQQWTLPAPLVDLLINTRPDWGSLTWTRLFTNSLAEESLNLP